MRDRFRAIKIAKAGVYFALGPSAPLPHGGNNQVWSVGRRFFADAPGFVHQTWCVALLIRVSLTFFVKVLAGLVCTFARSMFLGRWCGCILHRTIAHGVVMNVRDRLGRAQLRVGLRLPETDCSGSIFSVRRLRQSEQKSLSLFRFFYRRSMGKTIL